MLSLLSNQIGQNKEAWMKTKNSNSWMIFNQDLAEDDGLFKLDSNMEIPDMYKAINEVMTRLNTFEYDFRKDEEEAKSLGKQASQLNPYRKNRVKLPLAESYKLKISVERVVGWMEQKILESNLAPISITPQLIS